MFTISVPQQIVNKTSSNPILLPFDCTLACSSCTIRLSLGNEPIRISFTWHNSKICDSFFAFEKKQNFFWLYFGEFRYR